MTATAIMGDMGAEQKTRYQGVFVRHRAGAAFTCPAVTGKRCACRPGYIARVWDRAQGKQIHSPTFRTLDAAKNWRTDTIQKLDRGEMPDVRSDVRLAKAAEQFVQAARDGKVLTKHGRRYKPESIRDIEGALMVHVVPVIGAKRLADVRRGDVQRLVDDLAPTMSGSRVRTAVNALRSMYRWAQDRDQVSHDPAALVRLPAMDAIPRDRVASPAELEALLAALDADDARRASSAAARRGARPAAATALPYALAAYATARSQEIRLVRWGDVDFEAGTIALGADSAGRKSDAAQRTVPLLRPLKSRLRSEWMRQGKPADDRPVCPPPRSGSKTGLVSMPAIAKRARQAWGWDLIDGAWIAGENAMTPIGLHECRHTAASWMNAAGVNPKVASILMGHSTPERAASARAGAAGITLGRYTHALPGDIERSREQLDAFIDDALKRARKTGS